MQVADEPAPLHLAHDELDGVERRRFAHLVEHGEEDAGDQLQNQRHQREHTEVVPEVEILRRVVAGELRLDEVLDGQAIVQPALEPLRRRGRGSCRSRHYAAPFFSSTPMVSVWSAMLYGGMRRFTEAGEPSNTRPARS